MKLIGVAPREEKGVSEGSRSIRFIFLDSKGLAFDNLIEPFPNGFNTLKGLGYYGFDTYVFVSLISAGVLILR